MTKHIDPPANRCKSSNVVPLRRKRAERADADKAPEFQRLTFRRVMAQARAGTLDPGVVEALLLGVGVHP